MVDGLRISRDDSTLTITFDSEGGNVFSPAMMDTFVDEIASAASDEATRFVRLRAEGDAFCLGRTKGGTTPDELRATAGRIATVFETIRTSPLTVVAEVGGPAAGFGVGIVGASDIAVASERATFSFPEIRSGFAPAVVLSWARFQVPSRLLYDMVSTGDEIDAHHAMAANLVTEVVAADTLAARVDERLARLGSIDAFALRELKRFLVHTRTMDPATAAEASIDTLVFSGLRVIGNF
jgi:enoyl-CoA hydratase/carnithine racemase